MKYTAHDFCPAIAKLAYRDVLEQQEQALSVAVAARHLIERRAESDRDLGIVHLLAVIERILAEAGSLNYLRDYLEDIARREAPS